MRTELITPTTIASKGGIFVKRRQGSSLAVTILCLVIASAMVASIVRSTLAMLRQTRVTAERLQLEILAEDALQYGLSRYQQAGPEFQEEAWKISAEQWALHQPAEVQFRVQNSENGTSKLTVQCLVGDPNHLTHKITRSFPLKSTNTDL